MCFSLSGNYGSHCNGSKSAWVSYLGSHTRICSLTRKWHHCDFLVRTPSINKRFGWFIHHKEMNMDVCFPTYIVMQTVAAVSSHCNADIHDNHKYTYSRFLFPPGINFPGLFYSGYVFFFLPKAVPTSYGATTAIILPTAFSAQVPLHHNCFEDHRANSPGSAGKQENTVAVSEATSKVRGGGRQAAPPVEASKRRSWTHTNSDRQLLTFISQHRKRDGIWGLLVVKWWKSSMVHMEHSLMHIECLGCGHEHL